MAGRTIIKLNVGFRATTFPFEFVHTKIGETNALYSLSIYSNKASNKIQNGLKILASV